ncbi:unnamed protein product [Didymodactylos carnosus]|uniref:LTD domain-containing protein n=1 Tax=Didymodactylos carnosus TaxID=1234261 RepID=A0A814APS8_9BILA|nr:unnamed protein product [Didymodactylos carnosus]CAF0915846.1 unnamed protein product [Didymodactylos carnosus]CAF3682531.1 unnamed protein product [Didymodactylos carnosus]CAF3696828.1 unnamed protein product [Didymodactylos carnosus]
MAATATITTPFLFKPRTAVFEHPVTYDIEQKAKHIDLEQYYITLESRTTIQKCAKGPVCINECDNQGSYITIENTSRSKSIALSGWSIRQEGENETTIFLFPENCVLKPNYSLKIYSESNKKEQKNGDLVALSVPSWQTGSNFVTKLVNTDGKIAVKLEICLWNPYLKKLYTQAATLKLRCILN